MNPIHPAFAAFVSQIDAELIFAQVLIRRAADGFELRHVQDRDAAPAGLRSLEMADLRALAHSTAMGAFRPLKSAPNLRNGWRISVNDAGMLETALQHFYPGAMADWFAAQQPSPPITNYREFTNRQTGMYRITQMLTDAQVTQVTRAGCHADFCLKRRLWTVPGLAADTPAEKSLIPCLEPCAVLLEFARKATRIEQADDVALSAEDAATVAALLGWALEDHAGSQREADFDNPLNPRRLRLLLEKIRLFTTRADSATEKG